MTNVVTRCIQGVVSVAVVYVLFFLAPYGLLPFRIVLLLVAFLAAYEIIGMHAPKVNNATRVVRHPLQLVRRRPLHFASALLMPVVVLGVPQVRIPIYGALVFFGLLIGLAMLQIPWSTKAFNTNKCMSLLFSAQNSTQSFTQSSAQGFAPTHNSKYIYLFLGLYPGAIIALLILLSRHAEAVRVMPAGLLLVALYDTASYFCGKLWGVNNRGIFYISPHKSSAGCIGGVGATLLAVLGFALSSSVAVLPLLLISLATIIFATAGDLFESTIKRYAATKDSGRLIPGRGGLLDSIDSHLFALPLFSMLYLTLGAPST